LEEGVILSINKMQALISVSDKRGVTELAGELSALGYELLSTGGTAKALKDAGLKVRKVSEVTGFPEILQGRVKTLHPLIHGAILAQTDIKEQQKELQHHGIVPIQIVVVNLYPFEQTISREGYIHEEAVENIDIGGPTMIRAAAKNHHYVTVVVNPDRYPELIRELKAEGQISAETRITLAAEAFAHTACYDAAIAAYFSGLPQTSAILFPDQLSIGLKKVQDLRYGENPQQQAAFYTPPVLRNGLAAAVQLKGKELSFNNINDLGTAWALAAEFEKPTVVAVKHANPCGVGSAATVSAAYHLAYEADPVSIFGGVLAANTIIDGDAARKMLEIFLEVIAAPQFTDEALTLLSQKSDLRILQIPQALNDQTFYDIKVAAGAVLVQTIDREPVNIRMGKVVSSRNPSEQEWLGMAFAQKVVKHVRSNAIVIANEGQTVGIGAGQMNRIGAAKIAIEQGGKKVNGSVMGSDAFFPFPDVVEEAAKAGVTAIVQPGGSLKDQESIDVCDRFGLAMVFTGRRYFKH
jgi:phosphoribosylaminoimidazolecarboxamide formyltransferase / IMP cyclohydrolase